MKLEYEISIEDQRLIKEYLYSDKVFFIKLNKNRPYFSDSEEEKVLEKTTEYFSDLDNLKCYGMAFAQINDKTLSHGQDDRKNIKGKSIGFPSKEDNSINGNDVFERCHLIAYHLLAKKIDNNNNKNVNSKKIFIGTRFMNHVMFYYEKKISDYVDGTKNHVLYRVTPYFENSNKLAYGVRMEAKFVNGSGKEDKNLSFNIFVYNKQPYIEFNYKTGNDIVEKMPGMERSYVIDEKKKKFHIKGCASVWDFDKDRKKDFFGKRKDLIQNDYHPCAICDSGCRK